MSRKRMLALSFPTIFLLATASVRAEIPNGGFSQGDLANWTVEGHVVVETAPGNSDYYAVFKEVDSGGLSRIYQEGLDFDPIPDAIQFQFAMISDRKGRPSHMPPDSFTVALRDSNGGDLITCGNSAPSYVHGLLYIDSDHDPASGAVPNDPSDPKSRLFYDPSNVMVLGPRSDGSYNVTIFLDNITPQTDVRLEFGFANAANSVNTVVVLDNIKTESWECDPLVLEECARDAIWRGEGVHPPPESIAAQYQDDSFGWPSHSGGCKPVNESYSDILNCGCPTVTFRDWSIVDASDPPPQEVACRQIITDLDPDGEVEFYNCIQDIFGGCLSDPNHPDFGPETRMDAGNGCSAAELFTECLRIKMHAKGHLSVCTDRIAKELKDNGYFPNTPKGQLQKCVTNQLDYLWQRFYIDQECEGGPIDPGGQYELPPECQ